MTRAILTSSPSAGGTIRRMLKERRQSTKTKVIAGFDDFSHGPLSEKGGLRDFWDVRQAFWASFNLPEVDQAYTFDLPSAFQETIDAVSRSDQVEFWCALTVSDQIYLAVTLHLLELANVDLKSCKARQITDLQAEHGLGCLDVKPLSRVSDAAVPTDIDFDLYREAWRVLSEGHAGNIANFAKSIETKQPMAVALQAYLLRFPQFHNGLGSIDRALLGAGRKQICRANRIVGRAMAFGEPTIDKLGDWILSKRLVELSEVPTSPWFEIKDDLRNLRLCHACLTESGIKAREKYTVTIL